MVNVGSVGQSRDGDDRACYVILDDEPEANLAEAVSGTGMPASAPQITYRRIAYDFKATIRKIRDLGSGF